MDCIFCKIIDGDIPSSKVFEDDRILAFNDIKPQAKVHVIVIPKQHIKDADAITEQNSSEVAYIYEKIPVIADKLGLKDGYRIINNVGKHACQTVPHLHFHILGGEQFSEENLVSIG